jgi:sugar lactone lactonase YvrE
MTADAHTASRARGARTSFARRALGATLAGAAAWLLFAAPAGAARLPLLTPATGAGATAPTGLVRTPDGGLWIADSARGVCRVDEQGVSIQPVDSPYCQPGEDAHLPPEASMGLAFDRVNSDFYVGDGASNAGAVWRMHYDAASQSLFDPVRIVSLGEDRAEGVTLGEDGNALYVTTKDSSAVLRVTNLRGAATVSTAGFAATGAGSLTYLDHALYLAEGNAVTRLDLRPDRSSAVAQPVPGLPGGLASAVVADPDTGRVYAGTNNENSQDQVDVLRVADGSVETYETGFAAVSGLGLDRDGDLLVADDPGEATGAIDSVDQGRIWTVPYSQLDRPAVRIEAAPRAQGKETTARFAYSSPVAGATFECRLGGAAWAACPGTGSGEISYPDLAEGTHVFELRAVHPDPAVGTGNVVRRTFTVDTTAPSVWFTNLQDGAILPYGPVTVDFAGSEPGIDYVCSVDEAPATGCDPALRLTGLEPGEHTVQLTGTDMAGNAGTAVTRAFRVKSKPILQTETQAPAPSTGGAATTSAPGASAPAAQGSSGGAGEVHVAGALASSANASAAPALRVKRLRVPDRLRLRRGRAQATLRLDFGAPAEARRARVTLRDFEPKRGVRVLAKASMPLDGARTVRVQWTLTRAETRRLRPGRYRVTVAVRDRAGRMGPAAAATLVVRGTRR